METGGVVERLVGGEASWGYRGPGWYFWDETWAQAYGPYQTEAVAREMCSKYAASLE